MNQISRLLFFWKSWRIFGKKINWDDGVYYFCYYSISWCYCFLKSWYYVASFSSSSFSSWATWNCSSGGRYQDQERPGVLSIFWPYRRIIIRGPVVLLKKFLVCTTQDPFHYSSFCTLASISLWISSYIQVSNKYKIPVYGMKLPDNVGSHNHVDLDYYFHKKVKKVLFL